MKTAGDARRFLLLLLLYTDRKSGPFACKTGRFARKKRGEVGGYPPTEKRITHKYNENENNGGINKLTDK